VTLNVLDAFVTGSYVLVIPLLLVERSIDLTTIGVVFSALPLAFFVSRMLFASVADSIGLGKIFHVNALGNLASVVLYAVSSSPASYALAKGAQGVKDASLWAVNRNAAYWIAGSKNPYIVNTIEFARALTLALGAVVSGFLLASVGFQWTFIVLAILSALILIPARTLNFGQEKK